jgi:penicillin-binding protein 1A
MRRFVEVLWVNLTSSESPGASTITQQLARNTFLTLDKKVSRKIKEMILALQLEQAYSKDEILAMYLNEINFGSGAYGVQSAAHTFFSKDVWDLDEAECTVLVGVIQLPERYSPFRHLDRAYQRRTAVLESMISAGYLSREEARRVNQREVTVVDGRRRSVTPVFAPYFLEEVRKYVESRYGYDGLYNDGLRVTTTLVPEYQQAMEAAMAKHLLAMEAETSYPMTKARYDSLTAAGAQPDVVEYLQSASVLLEVRTGAMLGLVGGRDYLDYKWNLALQANRQPGSIFKPVIYLTALRNGYMASSILMDTPVVIDTGVSLWRPHNFNNRFMGPITLRYALSRSKNVVTAKLINDFGVSPVIETARQLGITSNLPPVHALALGAGEVNLAEMVSAYASFGNHGVRVEPYMITRIETQEGEILEEARLQQREVLDPATAYLMSNLMETTLTEGTAASARWRGFPYTAAGKTGTYNEYTDAWFVGFTPSYAAGVWVGFDQKVSMGPLATGSHMALPIWADFMGKVVAERGDEPFTRPDGLVDRLICLRSGMLATAGCDSTATEVFLADQFPQRPCDLHGGAVIDFEGYQRDFEALDDEKF